MFRQLYELARNLLFLTEDLQRTKTELKELREEVRDLAETVRDLKYKVRQNRADGEHAHEKLLLQLENALLKFERRLPAGGSGRSPESE